MYAAIFTKLINELNCVRRYCLCFKIDQYICKTEQRAGQTMWLKLHTLLAKAEALGTE
jgi:hypothetical protein